MSINISPIIIILDVGHLLDPDHHKEILNEYLTYSNSPLVVLHVY